MTNQQAPEIYTLHTVPNKGERPWSGIYTVRADAEHDAKVMRDVTGRDWSVVRLVVADTAATPTGPIARYKIGYATDDWGMRSSTPSGIPDHAGAWVRYEDHLAALAGQAVVAPAQPAAQQGVAYAEMPDLSDANGEIWSAIIYWKHAKRGEDALRKASELERVLSDQMRAFADATHALRASHGQAPASVLHLVNSAFAEIAMAFPKAFALHKVGIADKAVLEALAAPATPPGRQRAGGCCALALACGVSCRDAHRP